MNKKNTMKIVALVLGVVIVAIIAGVLTWKAEQKNKVKEDKNTVANNDSKASTVTPKKEVSETPVASATPTDTPTPTPTDTPTPSPTDTPTPEPTDSPTPVPTDTPTPTPEPTEEAIVQPEGKIIYLTFDDGPGQYTEQLLDILDKYNVKVTFFVTNQYSGYQDLIGEEARRGHTVAVHTYSHVYDNIYSSEEAFFADFDAMADIIEEQTGTRPDMLRFPGGSSNTVSDFNPGIMSRLVWELGERDIVYFDWNVSSGDAGETTDTNVVAANVIAQVQQHDCSIVLQHDVKGYSVEAVPQIIEWGLANGYTFLPLEKHSPKAHHGINN